MKRSMFAIFTAVTFALAIYGGFAPRVLAQPPPPAGNPPPPPGPWMMEHQGMGGPRMMGAPNMMVGPGGPNFRRMHEFEEHGCGGMGPEMWRGRGMGMGMGMGLGMGMGMGFPADAKTRAQLLQLRGRVMQMYGEWMEKRGKELEQQAK